MGLQWYLAMTAAEFSAADAMPESPAWMACHFSCYASGLSNLPRALPEGAMVIVNDRTPPHGHDPDLIASQLQQLGETQKVSRFLLDFQRPDDKETETLVSTLVRELDRPVGVAEQYAKGLQCPVFLSSPLPHKKLKDHLTPWAGREIWLEAAFETEKAVVTAHGCQFEPLADTDLMTPVFTDSTLHCQYHTDISDDRVVFTMQRKKEELHMLLEEAQTLGVQLTVGLYQQLGNDFF